MKDIITYSNSKSEIVKRYIDLKDSIVSLSDRNMKTVMITSPKEGDGHDNVTANLAVAISKGGYRTLIIDCNIDSNILGDLFGVKTKVGLSDYILNNKEFIDVINDTELENLKIITTGEKCIDILGNKKIDTLIEEGKRRFDYIIVNGVAVLHGNGSQVLSTYCDGIVIVVEYDKTQIEEIRKVQVKLDRFQDKIFGCVLNNY